MKAPAGNNVVRLFPEAANVNVPGVAFASISEGAHAGDAIWAHISRSPGLPDCAARHWRASLFLGSAPEKVVDAESVGKARCRVQCAHSSVAESLAIGAPGAITLAAAMGESMTPEATKRRGPLRCLPILVVPVIL